MPFWQAFQAFFAFFRLFSALKASKVPKATKVFMQVHFLKVQKKLKFQKSTQKYEKVSKVQNWLTSGAQSKQVL